MPDSHPLQKSYTAAIAPGRHPDTKKSRMQHPGSFTNTLESINQKARLIPAIPSIWRPSSEKAVPGRKTP